MSFLLVALVGGVFAMISAHHLMSEPGPLTADKTVILPSGADTAEILAQLESEGVIENPLLVNLAMWIEGKRNLKAGEYLFKQNVSANEVIDELVSGRQVLHAITIPEGLTTDQIIQRLQDSDFLAGELREPPKEGALLPETYKVTRGFPRSKLLAKMQEDQRKLLDQIWARRAKDLPIRTPYELVTLASIVEKETGKSDERPHVASVLVNRLRKGMRLQSDPTIIYGLVGGKATLGHGITRAELEKYSPYNTYLIDGLPPGPIANPGRASLEAAANPLQTPDLYFVADGTGGHVFSSTLDQHNRNVQQWRQHERDMKDKAGTPDVTPPALAPPAAPSPPRDQRGGLSDVMRFVSLKERHEDYPADRALAADDGAAHRLGKFGPWAGLLEVGAFDDPTLMANRRYDALRPARAYFTLAEAQPRRTTGFDTAALNAQPDDESETADAESAAGDMATYPVSEARRAEIRAREAKLGLAQSSDRLPEGVLGAPDPRAAAPAAYASNEVALAAGRRRVIDASEGSAIDPLRDKSWDLTTPKTVPTNLSLR
ncbi:MAG TPA: endolytic transglycosylase MltG [Methylocystis sp.]|nr:endolytic transglycosylase MltG [Methylocystis sp.]